MTEKNPSTVGSAEEHLLSQRAEKLKELRGKEHDAYPNHFRRGPECLAKDLYKKFGNVDAEKLEQEQFEVTIAGRMMTRRIMGKASFAHLQDPSGQIQIYVRRDNLVDDAYNAFKKWDIGDTIGAKGRMFRTRKGELSVLVDELEMITKSLRPLPEKWHGLSDVEARYRKRYLDLIMNEETRETFRKRTKTIGYIRQFLSERGYLEVETPMMQPIPGGATARPFVTFHNSLEMELFLRIAPELYLKRLVVGGFEKVFEINRNFRNEGLSTRHNPEFTMLEFYSAYEDYQDLMDLTETMIRGLLNEICGSASICYQGRKYDFEGNFERLSLKEAILTRNPEASENELGDLISARKLAKRIGVETQPTYGLGKVLLEIFEKTVETNLLDPTFITHYPAEVSPLAKRTKHDPELTERFEFFVAGREIANGFSELNDPQDQAERFLEQVSARKEGDSEAMLYDEDYIRALEYGMPPTAGEGIGIDRLVMLLTDSASIRDVILFPQMRRSG